jgi:hypothetical protein
VIVERPKFRPLTIIGNCSIGIEPTYSNFYERKTMKKKMSINSNILLSIMALSSMPKYKSPNQLMLDKLVKHYTKGIKEMDVPEMMQMSQDFSEHHMECLNWVVTGSVPTKHLERAGEILNKGKPNGICNRGACLSDIRVVWKHSLSDFYYCQGCAFMINDAHTTEYPEGLVVVDTVANDEYRKAHYE